MGKTQAGERINAVSVLTIGWIAGKTWTPDGLINADIRIGAETIHTVLPVPYQTNMLSFQINGIVPLGCVEYRSLESIESLYIRPSPII